MTASLFLPSQVQETWTGTMNDFLVAKAMFDCGHPLPSEWSFYEESETFSLFYRAVGYLFGTDAIEETRDYQIEISFPERVEWQTLRDYYPKMEEDENWIMDPVRELSTDYHFSAIECRFSESGFIIASEFQCDYFQLVKDYVEFKERFFFKLQLWRDHHASINSIKVRGDNNSVA